jgi:hypothetical protein
MSSGEGFVKVVTEAQQDRYIDIATMDFIGSFYYNDEYGCGFRTRRY